MFIVFEGVDGCGKDTQLNKSIDYIKSLDKNIQLWLTKEPTNNTPSGKIILNKLKSVGFSSPQEALSLYVKDRTEQSSIRKDIIKHSTILSSRFDYSTYAYQGESGLSFEEIYNEHDYNKILIPDITIIFNINDENIKKRLNGRKGNREFFEEVSFLKRVRDRYLLVAEKLKKDRLIYIIDANGTIEDVHQEVKNILKKHIGIK